LEVTVGEGLLELEKLCVMELVHPKSSEVVSRHVPKPNPRQQQLLAALKLTLPTGVPKAKVVTDMRKKINQVRPPFVI
jgi:hypothetical protein